MRVHRFGGLGAVSLVLLLLLLLVPLLLSALITFVTGFLAVIACDFILSCLVALAFDRGDFIKGRGSTGPSTFLI
jgi:hypothetical protein